MINPTDHFNNSYKGILYHLNCSYHSWNVGKRVASFHVRNPVSTCKFQYLIPLLCHHCVEKELLSGKGMSHFWLLWLWQLPAEVQVFSEPEAKTSQSTQTRKWLHFDDIIIIFSKTLNSYDCEILSPFPKKLPYLS